MLQAFMHISLRLRIQKHDKPRRKKTSRGHSQPLSFFPSMHASQHLSRSADLIDPSILIPINFYCFFFSWDPNTVTCKIPRALDSPCRNECNVSLLQVFRARKRSKNLGLPFEDSKALRIPIYYFTPQHGRCSHLILIKFIPQR